MSANDTPAGNPFADPLAAELAQVPPSPETLANPYAAPSPAPPSAGAERSSPPQLVGVFRFEGLVVQHEQAVWPPLCVGCGSGCEQFEELPVPAGSGAVTIRAALCATCRSTHRRATRFAQVLSGGWLLLFLLALVGLASGRRALVLFDGSLQAAVLLPAAVLLLMCLQFVLSLRQTLRLTGERRPPFQVFWGASPALLAQLPDFPRPPAQAAPQKPDAAPRV